MARNSEQLELAWLVTQTEGLLRTIRLRQVMQHRGKGLLQALTLQQCQMIVVVNERETVTLHELTQLLFAKAPSVSVMVDRLVELGILLRSENPKDRREVLIRVSPDHLSEIEEIKQRYLQTILDIFDKIGLDSARMWGAVCQRVRQALTEERAS